MVDVPVTFPEAALGAEIEVPTPAGERVRVKVPAAAPTARCCASRAAARRRAAATATCSSACRLTVPAKLSRQQREALEKFAVLDGGADVRAALFRS